MERILRDNEKIRRAEEIYYRRNRRNVAMPSNERPKTYLGSKIMLEMLILVILAIAVFAVKNKDYIFTKQFLESCAQYNVNLTEKWNSLMAHFKEEEQGQEIFINNEVPASAETVENSEVSQTQNTSLESDVQEQEIPVPQTQPEIVETQGIQMQSQVDKVVATDVQSLKNLYSFIKPLEGIVSSGFGARESKYQNVTGEHKGIDIAGGCGTPIKSSMAGVVTQVSSQGDYGNHVRITKDNVTTLYAHCQDIYVSEGQEIMEGQEIATVGSTGNSTGPHLHFEIRIDEVPVNPAEVIEF